METLYLQVPKNSSIANLESIHGIRKNFFHGPSPNQAALAIRPGFCDALDEILMALEVILVIESDVRASHGYLRRYHHPRLGSTLPPI
jgi:hypothetical protein